MLLIMSKKKIDEIITRDSIFMRDITDRLRTISVNESEIRQKVSKMEMDVAIVLQNTLRIIESMEQVKKTSADLVAKNLEGMTERLAEMSKIIDREIKIVDELHDHLHEMSPEESVDLGEIE
jgi:hypothetical protein